MTTNRSYSDKRRFFSAVFRRGGAGEEERSNAAYEDTGMKKNDTLEHVYLFEEGDGEQGSV